MKRENWETIDVCKGGKPPTWTFKLCPRQILVWALFGNDRDGVTPEYKGEQWTFWRWWLRNRWSNFKWYILGYARWEEGNPYASWDHSHLEVNYWCHGWLEIAFIKPIKRGWIAWRPWIKIEIGKFDAHIGWRPPRGQVSCGILWDKEG